MSVSDGVSSIYLKSTLVVKKHNQIICKLGKVQIFGKDTNKSKAYMHEIKSKPGSIQGMPACSRPESFVFETVL